MSRKDGLWICDYCKAVITHDQAARYEVDSETGIGFGCVHFCSKECQRRYQEQKITRAQEAANTARFEKLEKEMLKQQKELLDRQKQEEEEKVHQAFLAKCVNIDGAYYSPDKTTLIEVDKMVRRLNVIDGVIEIGKEACKNCTELKSVTLPESLEEIEENAFGFCSSLTEIKFPKSLKKLDHWAFSCSGLKSVEIPENIEEIGPAAFGQCNNLESVSIAGAQKRYANSIFLACKSLKNVKLPEGMSEIPDQMFYGCTALSEIQIPATVKRIGQCAFRDCTSLVSVQSILNQVEELGGGAFQNTGVTEVTIPVNIKKLESYDVNDRDTLGAFSCCKSLKSVTIAEGREKMGIYAFSECFALEKVSFPSTLKSIGAGSFFCCKNLSSIEFPDGLEYIRIHAFSYTNLSSINLPDSITEIGEGAFSTSSTIRGEHISLKLKELRIPSGVTKLENAIVYGCSELESITIPSTITEISGNPFKGCSSLKVVNVEGDGLNSEVSNKIEKCLEESYGKGKVKFKSGALLSTAKAGASAAAKTVGGLSSMLGTAVSSLKENDNIQNTINETKDAFKKAFGGLFGKK